MKDKIVTLVLGILIGAVITAGAFLVFGNNGGQSQDFSRGGRGNMPDGTGFEQREPNGNMIKPVNTVDITENI